MNVETPAKCPVCSSDITLKSSDIALYNPGARCSNCGCKVFAVVRGPEGKPIATITGFRYFDPVSRNVYTVTT